MSGQEDCRITGMAKESSRSVWVAAGIVSAVALSVYLPALKGEFVNWDDDLFITRNATLGGLTPQHIAMVLTNKTASSTWYTPLTGLRWCITYQFCGLSPFGFHLANVLFHAVDAGLVFLLLSKLLRLRAANVKDGKTWRITLGAALGALVWALHPMQVETAAWAVNAYGQSMFFVLVSLLCYLKANEGGAKRRTLLSASYISFAASLLSQPVTIGFAVVFVVIDIFLLKRLGGDKGWWKTASVRAALFEKVPFFALAAIFLAVNAAVLSYSQTGGHRFVPLSEFGILSRVMQATYILAYYLWRPFWPVNLSPAYTRLAEFEPLSGPFIASAAIVAAAIAVAVAMRKRRPDGMALLICYVALLWPVLGWADHPHCSNDRYFITVGVLFSAVAAELCARAGVRWLRATTITGAVLVLGLGTLSVMQMRIWRNTETLMRYMIDKMGGHPFSAGAEGRLGKVLAEQNKTDEAITHFQRAVRLAPKQADKRANLAVLLGVKGRFDEAITLLKTGAETSDRPGTIYHTLGQVYFLRDQTNKAKATSEECVSAFEKAVELEPKAADSRYGLAVAYSGQSKWGQAVEQFRKAVEFEPGSETYHYGLGVALLQAGDKEGAMGEYKYMKAKGLGSADRLLGIIKGSEK